MNLICVDDEALVLQYTLAVIRSVVPSSDEVHGFTSSAEALEWAAANPVDLAILDIDMPVINGLELAARIRQIRPAASIIFLTGYSEYAVDAFSMHVSGYLLKPVSRDKVADEISYALEKKDTESSAPAPARISAVCFGGFDLLVDGEVVSFARSKSKELLAYLVDRHGSSITRAEAAAVLWEDSFYDRSMQKQLDVVMRSLRATLTNYGVEDILEIQKGSIRIRPEMIDCDLYRFTEGDANAIDSYRGEYMTAYSWAEFTAAYLDRKAQKVRR